MNSLKSISDFARVSFAAVSLLTLLGCFVSEDEDVLENMCPSEYAMSFRPVYEANDDHVRGKISRAAVAKMTRVPCKDFLATALPNKDCNVSVKVNGKQTLVSVSGSIPLQTDQALRTQCKDWAAFDDAEGTPTASATGETETSPASDENSDVESSEFSAE